MCKIKANSYWEDFHRSRMSLNWVCSRNDLGEVDLENFYPWWLIAGWHCVGQVISEMAEHQYKLHREGHWLLTSEGQVYHPPGVSIMEKGHRISNTNLKNYLLYLKFTNSVGKRKLTSRSGMSHVLGRGVSSSVGWLCWKGHRWAKAWRRSSFEETLWGFFMRGSCHRDLSVQDTPASGFQRRCQGNDKKGQHSSHHSAPHQGKELDLVLHQLVSNVQPCTSELWEQWQAGVLATKFLPFHCPVFWGP